MPKKTYAEIQIFLQKISSFHSRKYHTPFVSFIHTT